jgi:hypothetical protein
MSLTVVTVRDENGAPSTLESYAGASRYRIGDGNLEIMAPDKQILGLYDSGNWLSVYAGDSVKVISVGTVLAFTPVDLDSSSPADLDSSSPDDTDFSSPDDTDFSSPGDTEADPVELGSAAELEPEVDASSIEPEVDASSTEPEAEENVVAAANSDEPTAPTPAPRQRPVPGPAVDPPPSNRAIDFVTPTERPPWLRPVAVRPRALRAPRSAGTQAPAPAASRMMRVVIRPRARAAAPAEPPTRDTAQPDGSEPK